MEQSYTVKEMFIGEAGRRIYLNVYLPESETPLPAVLFAHEFNGSHRAGAAYAEVLAAKGAAVVLCDFRGGGVKSRSDGLLTEVSLLTEVEDVLTVLAEVQSWPFIDRQRIALLGASMGGIAAALAAAQKRDEIAALALFYPAMVLFDDVKALFASPEAVPPTYCYRNWVDVGRVFFTDVWDLPVYERIAAFDKPVLLLHGTADELVDIRYSEQTAAAYRDVRFVRLQGAPHSFRDEPHLSAAMDEVTAYLVRQGVLPA